MNARHHAPLLVLALAATLATACGGSNDDSSSESTTTTAASDGAATAGATEEQGGGEGGELTEGLASVSLETKADVIRDTLGDEAIEKVEVDDSTIHVYLRHDDEAPEMTCIIVSGVLSDGETAVVHTGGTETTC